MNHHNYYTHIIWIHQVPAVWSILRDGYTAMLICSCISKLTGCWSNYWKPRVQRPSIETVASPLLPQIKLRTDSLSVLIDYPFVLNQCVCMQSRNQQQYAIAPKPSVCECVCVCVCIHIIDVGLRQPVETVHTCRSASISLMTGMLRSSAPALKHWAGSLSRSADWWLTQPHIHTFPSRWIQLYYTVSLPTVKMPLTESKASWDAV